MSSSARRDQSSGPALWLPVTIAFALLAAVDLTVWYGALHLSEPLAHHTSAAWALLGPALLLVLSGAALLGDPLSRSGGTTLLLAAFYTPCFGYGLYQALAAYGPGLAHTAARLL